MKTLADMPTRFTEVRLANWRNFRSATIPLKSRVFLVGPNASGKSNLLDAFRFLRDLASQGGGLHEAVHRRGGVSALRALSARKQSDIEIGVAIGRDGCDIQWQYEISISHDGKSRPIIRRETVLLCGRRLVDRPNDSDERDAEQLTQTYLEQVTKNQEFRGLVEFLASVRYLHVVPQLIREPDRSVGRTGDPYGGDLLEQLASTRQNTREARLRRIRDALRVAVPQLQELELKRDARGTPHLRGRYRHWRPSGAWQTEEQFSDGTLRLLGLLWSMLDGQGPLLLEEPELSLHPGVVRHVPSMFARAQRESRRQVMLSTHSPELLTDEGIGLDEVLVLEPSGEGTTVKVAATIDEVRALLSAGVPLPDAVLPYTESPDVVQLALFGG